MMPFLPRLVMRYGCLQNLPLPKTISRQTADQAYTYRLIVKWDYSFLEAAYLTKIRYLKEFCCFF